VGVCTLGDPLVTATHHSFGMTTLIIFLLMFDILLIPCFIKLFVGRQRSLVARSIMMKCSNKYIYQRLWGFRDDRSRQTHVSFFQVYCTYTFDTNLTNILILNRKIFKADFSQILIESFFFNVSQCIPLDPTWEERLGNHCWLQAIVEGIRDECMGFDMSILMMIVLKVTYNIHKHVLLNMFIQKRLVNLDND